MVWVQRDIYEDENDDGGDDDDDLCRENDTYVWYGCKGRGLKGIEVRGRARG